METQTKQSRRVVFGFLVMGLTVSVAACAARAHAPVAAAVSSGSASVMIENETVRDIEIYGIIGGSPVLFGVAAAALPSRIGIPTGLQNDSIEMLFHVVGTEDWFRSARVRIEANTDYTVRIGVDGASGRAIVASRPPR